jgi:hypothetical protein
MLVENITEVLRFVDGDSARGAVTSDVYAQDVGEVAEVLDFESITEGGLELVLTWT